MLPIWGFIINLGLHVSWSSDFETIADYILHSHFIFRQHKKAVCITR